MSKADLPDVQEAWTTLRKKFKKRGIDLRLVSAATGAGVRELLFELYALSHAEAPPVREAPPAKKKRTRTAK
jgi:GTP-binding protein